MFTYIDSMPEGSIGQWTPRSAKLRKSGAHAGSELAQALARLEKGDYTSKIKGYRVTNNALKMQDELKAKEHHLAQAEAVHKQSSTKSNKWLTLKVAEASYGIRRSVFLGYINEGRILSRKIENQIFISIPCVENIIDQTR